jgi:hypothetical protein
MTLFTAFQFGIFKVIPLSLHKIVETIVGPVLVVIPWVLKFSEDMTSRYVFIVSGIVIILVGLLSDYGSYERNS